MIKFNSIIKDALFVECVNKNILFEKDRIFCGHDFNHFLDTARIAYIIALEEDLKIEKEIIYIASILHDIGRFKQYEENIPHHIASHDIAKYLLDKYSFEEEEKIMILDAILNHRELKESNSPLNRLLYLSDKLSRNCYSCNATLECNWSDDKKNIKIKY